MIRSRKLTEVEVDELTEVNGGMKWEGLPQSTNVEDMRPNKVCSEVWPRGDQGPSIFGDQPPKDYGKVGD